MANTLATPKQNLTLQQRSTIEAELIDEITAWKVQWDKLAQISGAVKFAIARAKELEIWAPKYPDFKSWLAAECDVTESWAYRLIGSARMIQDIQKVAKDKKVLGPLTTPEATRVLQNLPERAIQDLKKLPTAQAAMAALNALQKKKGLVPTAMEVHSEVVKLSPPKPFISAPPAAAAPAKPVHPVLAAFDRELALVKRDVEKFKLKPEMVYQRLRVAIEDAL